LFIFPSKFGKNKEKNDGNEEGQGLGGLSEVWGVFYLARIKIFRLLK
jgi:hypothetical protein